MFKKIIFMGFLVASLSSMAASLESGKYVGSVAGAESSTCSLTLENNDGDFYASNGNVQYMVEQAFRTTADVDCPGEHSRYVGFQINGDEDREVEICVDTTNKVFQIKFTHIDENSVLVSEKTCVDVEKK